MSVCFVALIELSYVAILHPSDAHCQAIQRLPSNKNCAEEISKFFDSFQFRIIFFLFALSNIFCKGLSEQTNFAHN